MEDKKFCQSCGMPMEKTEDFGTNNDGEEMGSIAVTVIRKANLPMI